MIESAIPLLPGELKSLLQTRSSPNGASNDIRLTNRRIFDALIQIDPLPRIQGQRIGQLYFDNCVFEAEVKIGDAQRAGNVTFKNCLFTAKVTIEANDNITLDGHNEFHEDCTIQLGKKDILENISFQKTMTVHFSSISRGHFRIENVNEKRDDDLTMLLIHLDNSTLDCQNVHVNSLFISGSNISSIQIVKSTINVIPPCALDAHSFLIAECKIQGINTDRLVPANAKLDFADSTFEFLTVDGSSFREMQLTNCAVTDLNFTGIIEKEKYITVSSCPVRNIKFESFYNNGTIIFREVTMEPLSILTIANATLGKTDFILCQFRSAGFVFLNSKITDIFMAQTQFPAKILGKEVFKYEQARLAFGQLRTAFDKQGDTVHALEYQAREIESHYHSISSYFVRKFPFLHFTKLNLGLNKISNNFGRDWGRGVLFSLGVGLFFFTILLWTSREYSLHGTWRFDRRLIVAFFRFMNPLRVFDLETLFQHNGRPSYVTLTGWSYIFDFIGRIAVAYGYYQTIQAFRRFGRK